MPRSVRPARVGIVGGGAAGFFAAIACAEAAPDAEVFLLERGAEFLAKVRLSGGGRCNVTHADENPREFAARYPRGGRALIGPLHRFGPRETMAWFASRGVTLKTEKDGRVFPTTDKSETIVDALLSAAQAARVETALRRGVTRAAKTPSGGFELFCSDGPSLFCDRLLLATGGTRLAAGAALAAALGHALAPPVPSLFGFRVASPWLEGLAGVSVASVEVAVPQAKLRERGPILVTHSGLSGPAILRLSAWGARAIHALGDRFSLQVNWLPGCAVEAVDAELRAARDRSPRRRVVGAPWAPLPARLWEKLCLAAGVGAETCWAGLSDRARRALVAQLTRGEILVTGKSLNKEEFVTCGGVALREVDFKTMESRVCPGLYLAGELLDVDGLTGGFNLQAAWTTGWIAGCAMAGGSPCLFPRASGRLPWRRSPPRSGRSAPEFRRVGIAGIAPHERGMGRALQVGERRRKMIPIGKGKPVAVHQRGEQRLPVLEHSRRHFAGTGADPEDPHELVAPARQLLEFELGDRLQTGSRHVHPDHGIRTPQMGEQGAFALDVDRGVLGKRTRPDGPQHVSLGGLHEVGGHREARRRRFVSRVFRSFRIPRKEIERLVADVEPYGAARREARISDKLTKSNCISDKNMLFSNPI
ncbi:MAG: NAD(P)/FAD-dependent oxidoreductase [Verrucomicrobiae bacterium]|nr:NAD(P)/FAD-dependent oxidoreductase [Verrucomicrobiae bacterium]